MSNKLPSSLIKRLNEEFGFEEHLFFKVHEEAEQLTSIRLNPFKKSDVFPDAALIPWTNNGRYLQERPSFIADPLFHAGCYYVQEASSMFLEHILREAVDLDEELRILDLCAAPGGKSTLISSLINQDSLLISNEIIKTRVPVLADNLTKWGRINTVVSSNDPRDFQRLAGYFDVMVVDAPCSGSGMWRKDPGTLNEWSEANVALCSQRQQRILADAYPALKEGGLLIYSTCSYSREENEEIADWLFDNFDLSPVRIPTNSSWNIVETESEKHHCPGYRFYPHKVKGEGFFVSCFKKNEEESPVATPRSKPIKPNKNDTAIVETWIRTDSDLAIIPVKESYAAIQGGQLEDIQLLQSKLYLKKSGVMVGKIVGKDLVPDHELALSLILNERISRTELNYEQAISYLRKDELRIYEISQGWSLMCYSGFGLGWAKILPNRLNNYYPKELRILKDI
ncbi:RsmB/NOP family class I SAM-dependent RNA methyltransferase [Pedobacter sp. SYSU D00535]|uniref:methyltransferase RsmF C-terminal domain-like protein n=1 Tax=Pedobacter sp. SYSU D00535 TaxID=2810308 RepID=UPI001A96D8E0|nr:RsmB/NOP family class I SAM-dependent RNA methyltransferase [Pedobacter sp. SYSU D00535]